MGVRHLVWSYMSLYNRLVKEKERLGKKALRNPRTNKELLDRKRWERIYTILTRRYDYGIESMMAKTPLQKIKAQLDKLEKLHAKEEVIVEKITEIIDEEENEDINENWEGTD